MHELGHVVALRREGIPASAPMFIPFLGAYVTLKRMPQDAWAEAKVGLAGPVFGLFSSVAVLAAALALDSDLLRGAAYFGFFINLFNLIPLTPLDGGRAAAAIHPYVWLAGAVGMVLLFLVFPSPILILIALLGGLDGWRRLQAYRAGPRRGVLPRRRPPAHRGRARLRRAGGHAVGRPGGLPRRGVSTLRPAALAAVALALAAAGLR